ncbi:carbon-nitrogen hydrolase [Candidatus Peregrinibacteria bacterium]|nr:carbon-nitrogen hydrolase [Candidatus Peregrinibacteria bacterium]MBI3816478.1 carbon-nitrogen hydrolase [Candidatus Peregrinibacteria bacterium]
MPRPIALGLVQMSMTSEPAENITKALAMVEDAAGKGAQIVVLPELFQSRYFCQRPDDAFAFERSESIPGPTTEKLSELARRLKIVLVGGSLFENAGGKHFNTSVVMGPDGEIIGTYRKTHIPEDALYHEQRYFAPGDTGIKVFDTPFGRIAPLICFDQWYPEAARIAALQGAELILYPTAIGAVDAAVEENITGDWEQMWRNAMLGHAACNNVYVAAVNRCGTEDHLRFWGGSFVANPSSAILARTGDEEAVLLAQCDLDKVRPLQDAWRFFENRRSDMYGALAVSE